MKVSPEKGKDNHRLEKALQEREQALSDVDRLSKEAVAHKYTVQSLKD